jgi:hypothetical protein
MKEVAENGTRFAHYTSAATALKIIQKGEVWMRNASVMNDFSEIKHGQNCLVQAWNHEVHGTKFKSLLEEIEPGLADRLAKSFDDRKFDRDTESYMISISEHGFGTVDEDQYGRLSMWRAYGGDTNVAFVFNNGPFLRESNATNAYTSPVLYCDPERFTDNFVEVVANLEKYLPIAKAMGGERVKGLLESMFHFASLSAKHPGFAEEREWRVILSPTVFPTKKLRWDIEIVDGAPQRVYKFPLKNFPEDGFFGATIPELLEEIIIGPTANSYIIYDALTYALQEAGVEDATAKVRISDIPLRR